MASLAGRDLTTPARPEAADGPPVKPAPSAAASFDPAASARMLTLARRVRELSIQAGNTTPIEVVGRSSALTDALRQIQNFARRDEPVLITGESGVGKETFAKVFHLLSHRAGKPFTSVRCSQCQDDNLTFSELFGHEKGGFSGAVGTHKGLFETAAGGVLFLDEVADLNLNVQDMLLRVLADKELKPLGSASSRGCDMQVIAATSRSLRQLAAEGVFRQDLYFRLRYFPLHLPPLRERGNDWRQILEHFLSRLNLEHGLVKSFSAASLRLLASYHWPGNIRELASLVSMAFALCKGTVIEPRDFIAELNGEPAPDPAPTLGSSTEGCGHGDFYQRMVVGKESFWDVIQRPFLGRDLSRAQAQAVIKQGLTEAHGSYRRAATLFRIKEQDYQKYMDFLRHHRLKPSPREE